MIRGPQYKIYELDIDSFDFETGMNAVSLVEFPAVEIDFLTFSDQHIQLTHLDEDKHIVTGVALLADTPIYRNNPPYGEHYIVFTKETIRKMVEKYSKLGLYNSVNLEHKDDTFVDNVIMLESYFIDKERHLHPKEFSNVNDGSWIVSYKVNDLELWKDIKEGKFKGFSIQGWFDYGDQVNNDELPEPTDQINNNTNKNNNTEMSFIEKFKLAKLLIHFEEARTDKGTLVYEGDLIEGLDVFIEKDGELVPAEDGEYIYDGKTITIVSGKVESIVDENEPETETETEEQPIENEDVPEVENPTNEGEETDTEAIVEIRKEVNELYARIEELERIITEKDNEIEKLNSHIEQFSKPAVEEVEVITNKENKFSKYFKK